MELRTPRRDIARADLEEMRAAIAAMVKWCDRNDWGCIPKKLEMRLRNACRDGAPK